MRRRNPKIGNLRKNGVNGPFTVSASQHFCALHKQGLDDAADRPHMVR